MKKSTHKGAAALKAILEKDFSAPELVLTQARDELDSMNPPHNMPIHTVLQAIGAESLSDPSSDPMPEPTVQAFASAVNSQSESPCTPIQKQSITAMATLLNKEINKSAVSLDLDEADLMAWINLQHSVPSTAILSLLRTMRQLQLDPLSNEIGTIQHEDGRWQAYITIEGCCTLLNRHPQFNGLTFTQSDASITGIPEWIECTIYRRDRAVPITVREYLVEVQADKPIWKKMPRRILRHRALQQCVRLALT